MDIAERISVDHEFHSVESLWEYALTVGTAFGLAVVFVVWASLWGAIGRLHYMAGDYVAAVIAVGLILLPVIPLLPLERLTSVPGV